MNFGRPLMLSMSLLMIDRILFAVSIASRNTGP